MITAPNSELFELSELPNYLADSTVLAPSSTITNVRPPLRSISSMSPSQPAVEPASHSVAHLPVQSALQPAVPRWARKREQ